MLGVVILGAGHAGSNAAVFLRQSGYDGKVVIVSEETENPYQRPPLSKAWLTEQAEPKLAPLHPLGMYEKLGIEIRNGVKATAIDLAAKAVTLDSGDQIGYEHLIVATGARPRKLDLPGAELPLVHELRHIADARRLKAALKQARKIAIVGGGYIGLEVASSARALGVEAVVLERESRVLSRVASAGLAEFFERYHRSHGVEVLTGVNVAAFEPTGVRLLDGSLIAADCVLVGVGAFGNFQLAQEAGLKCEPTGICVDEAARTSHPSVYAIGDVTYRPLSFYGRSGRLESVHNAVEQAKQAAFAILGKPAPPPEVPWFWSEQFGLKLQIAGLIFGNEKVVLRGDMATAKFSLFHLLNGVVTAVEAVNSSPEFLAAKKWITARQSVDPERLADVTIPISEIIEQV